MSGTWALCFGECDSDSKPAQNTNIFAHIPMYIVKSNDVVSLIRMGKADIFAHKHLHLCSHLSLELSVFWQAGSFIWPVTQENTYNPSTPKRS